MVGALALALVATLAIPAVAFTNACGNGTHSGSYTNDDAWAYWNSVNDPDCWVQVAAKCGTTPTSGDATWYWGAKVYIGSTSYYDCDWNFSKTEIQNWGYGWGPQ
ncbi:MAG: hypothetical protein ACRDVM_02715 [Acidimicrobiia bacterium]